MLVRDRLGYIHNVPNRSYGSQEVIYDGLGNPVGFAFLAPLLSAIGPALTSALPSIVGAVAPALGNLLGGGKKDDAPAAPSPAPAAPSSAPPTVSAEVSVAPPAAAFPPCPACPVCPVCGNSTDVVQSLPLMPPMPLPMNVAYLRPRPRRRFHARSR